MSPTQRSLKLLRGEGYTAQVVEYYNSFSRKRVDLFNWIDIVAVDVNSIVGVQTTSANNVSARFHKMDDNIALEQWLIAGGKLEIHGWGKNVKNRWVVRRYLITFKDGQLTRVKV